MPVDITKFVGNRALHHVTKTHHHPQTHEK